MSTDIEEQATRQSYRITCDPSWRVLKLWKGNWVVAYYCKNEDGAARCLERCVKRELAWAAMTPEQRAAAVLREHERTEQHGMPR